MAGAAPPVHPKLTLGTPSTDGAPGPRGGGSSSTQPGSDETKHGPQEREGTCLPHSQGGGACYLRACLGLARVPPQPYVAGAINPFRSWGGGRSARCRAGHAGAEAGPSAGGQLSAPHRACRELFVTLPPPWLFVHVEDSGARREGAGEGRLPLSVVGTEPVLPARRHVTHFAKINIVTLLWGDCSQL